MHFLGRRKEMLKVKGMSVFPPRDRGAAWPASGGVGLRRGGGRDDAERGQVPVAYIQLKPEADGSIYAADLRGMVHASAWPSTRFPKFASSTPCR